MSRSIREIAEMILVIVLSLCTNHKLSNADDSINGIQSITDAQSLVSSGGVFELGFFNPESSQNWYLGIWYHNIPTKTVVWVANRQIPLKNRTSGVLKVIPPGRLILLNDTNGTVWSSSSSSKTARNPVVQLLDSGNLVLRDANDDGLENYLWQSFDYPTDTLLPGMALGLNSVYLTAWKTNEDPSPGDYMLQLDATGYPQLFVRKGSIDQFREGPWNGVYFSGSPYASSPTFMFKVHKNKEGVFYAKEDASERSVLYRVRLNPNGITQRWRWVSSTKGWDQRMSIPLDTCDAYNSCGAHGRCTAGNSPLCVCLDKFVPKDPKGWAEGDWSTNGCVRRRPLDCTAGDGFVKYGNLKVPDARRSWYNETMSTLEECRMECLKNCSCAAYATLNISEGGRGCLFWFGDLTDIRVLPVGGQDLYIRMASSELLDSNGKSNKILKASLAAGGAVLLILCILLCIWIRRRNQNERHAETHSKDLELPLFDLSTISKATNSFAFQNKLGEGGFGTVYKGTLEDGQNIAVKRMSETSKQGVDEFKNEAIFVAKLQHRNLVKLLGCCIQREEKMLVYEYMPNKSLDTVLFDKNNKMFLDWSKRFQVVTGIARGLVYLHHDSRLRIIHRDLKASNVLLDSDMNPKISDFGIAKRHRENLTEDKTTRIVGTYGYMPPEYVVRGRFSRKSDVFSFGVIVLEIVSGRRNNSYSRGDHHLNLLGHAWTLHMEGRSIDIIDTKLRRIRNFEEVLRVIHVGLLCVQQDPHERPSMTSVVAMLNNDSMLPQPKRPGFFREPCKSSNVSSELASTNEMLASTNEMTITTLAGR